MTHIASIALISGLFAALRQPERTHMRAGRRVAGEFAAHGWVYLLELSDEIEMHDRRFCAISDLLEEMCQMFEVPIRWVMSRPKSHGSDVMMRQATSAVDAASLIVILERLGFQVDPSPFVEAVSLEVSKLNRLSNAEFNVAFFEKTKSRQLTVLSTDPPVHSGQKERFKTVRGYQVVFEHTDGRASLTVRGPKYRFRKPPENVRCDFCDMSYLQGDLESSLDHRQRHRRKKHSYEPKPNRRLLERLALNSSADVVDERAPKWMHHEVYERAMMFKREMGYDFPQWAAPPVQGRTEEDGIAYLLTDHDAPGMIVGACAFRMRQQEWMLDWVWVAPGWRRKGILERYWPRFVQSYRDFLLEHPVSPGMLSFMQKHGTQAQKVKLRLTTADNG